MAEKKNGIGASLEDLALPEEYPEPYLDGDGAQAAGQEDPKDRAGKCSPKLLEMLRAAETKWTPQNQDREKTGALETGTKDPITEGLKTNMVSRDSAYIKALFLTPVIRLHRKHGFASTQTVNDQSCRPLEMFDQTLQSVCLKVRN